MKINFDKLIQQTPNVKHVFERLRTWPKLAEAKELNVKELSQTFKDIPNVDFCVALFSIVKNDNFEQVYYLISPTGARLSQISHMHDGFGEFVIDENGKQIKSNECDVGIIIRPLVKPTLMGEMADKLGNSLFAIETNMESLKKRTNKEGQEIIAQVTESIESLKQLKQDILEYA